MFFHVFEEAMAAAKSERGNMDKKKGNLYKWCTLQNASFKGVEIVYLQGKGYWSC